MIEPNPYQTPQTPEPLSTGKVVKRGLGVIAILLFTPVAVGIAALTSCGAAWMFASVSDPIPLGTAILIGWTIFLTPPLIVLVVMVWWAIRRQTAQRQAVRPKE